MLYLVLVEKTANILKGNGGEIIQYLCDTILFDVTPSLIEALFSDVWLGYQTGVWDPLLAITPQGRITEYALEYALAFTSQVQVIPALDSILKKNSSLKLSTAAWGTLFLKQRNAETMSRTFDCLAEHNKVPSFSERDLKSLVNGNSASNVYPVFERRAQENHRELPITAEVLHACVNQTQPKNLTLELLLQTLSQNSRTIETTPELWRHVLSSDMAEALIDIFKKFDLHVPRGPPNSEHIQHALVNMALKDDTIEDLFQISAKERKSFCFKEENLLTLVEVNNSMYGIRKALAFLDRAIPFTSKILTTAFEEGTGLWLRFAAEQNPESFPALITKELIVKASLNSTAALNELQNLSLQLQFDLPICSNALQTTYAENFTILANHIQRKNGLDTLYSLLTAETLVELSRSPEGMKIITQVLFAHFGEEKVQALYSEPMLMAAAGNGCVSLIDLVYEYIPEAKPKEYYLNIAKLYEATWSVILVTARTLLNKGVYPNAKNAQHRTFLASACEYNETCMVRLALRYPTVDCNAKDRREWTPLMIAAGIGSYEIVEELLKSGAETHHRNANYSMTAEEIALWNGHYGVAKMIRNNQV